MDPINLGAGNAVSYFTKLLPGGAARPITGWKDPEMPQRAVIRQLLFTSAGNFYICIEPQRERVLVLYPGPFCQSLEHRMMWPLKRHVVRCSDREVSPMIAIMSTFSLACLHVSVTVNPLVAAEIRKIFQERSSIYWTNRVNPSSGMWCRWCRWAVSGKWK